MCIWSGFFLCLLFWYFSEVPFFCSLFGVCSAQNAHQIHSEKIGAFFVCHKKRRAFVGIVLGLFEVKFNESKWARERETRRPSAPQRGRELMKESKSCWYLVLFIELHTRTISLLHHLFFFFRWAINSISGVWSTTTTTHSHTQSHTHTTHTFVVGSVHTILHLFANFLLQLPIGSILDWLREHRWEDDLDRTNQLQHDAWFCLGVGGGGVCFVRAIFLLEK